MVQSTRSSLAHAAAKLTPSVWIRSGSLPVGSSLGSFPTTYVLSMPGTDRTIVSDATFSQSSRTSSCGAVSLYGQRQDARAGLAIDGDGLDDVLEGLEEVPADGARGGAGLGRRLWLLFGLLPGAGCVVAVVILGARARAGARVGAGVGVGVGFLVHGVAVAVLGGFDLALRLDRLDVRQLLLLLLRVRVGETLPVVAARVLAILGFGTLLVLLVLLVGGVLAVFLVVLL